MPPDCHATPHQYAETIGGFQCGACGDEVIDPVVEAVAQAIRDAALNRSGKAKPWATLPARVRKDFRLEAAAAIEAYRRAAAL